MKRLPFVLLTGWFAVAGCSKQDSASESKPANNANASGNPITAPVDYLGAVAKAKKTAGGVVNMASLNQAIQLFQAEEDRFPSNLNELVAKKYLPSLPAPPPGKKLVYNPSNGQVRLINGP